MTVKPAHFGNRKHADAAERSRCDGKHFTLRDVRVQGRVRSALQAEKRDIAGIDIAFERTARKIRFAARRFEQAVLNELIFDGRFAFRI